MEHTQIEEEQNEPQKDGHNYNCCVIYGWVAFIVFLLKMAGVFDRLGWR